jgi:hypothetical protein
LGLFAQRAINQNLFLRTELVWAVKGYRSRDNTTDRNTTIGLNYLNLPLVAGYKVNSAWSAFLGPEVGLLGPVYASGRSGKRSDLRHIINYENLDAGLLGGVMYTFKPKLSLDLRYSHGFSKVLIMEVTDAQGNFLHQASQKNNKALQLSLNYFFRA